MIHLFHRGIKKTSIHRVCKCGRKEIFVDEKTSPYDFWNDAGWVEFKGNDEAWDASIKAVEAKSE
jgi:hypothetical protein